jgi:hypothetical protein
MDDPLIKQAQTLVQAANVNATTAFIPLLDRFPILRGVDIKHWDFVLTIAGVFVAVTRLSNLRTRGTPRTRVANEGVYRTCTMGCREWNTRL